MQILKNQLTYNVDFAIINTEFDDIFVSLNDIFHENLGDNSYCV